VSTSVAHPQVSGAPLGRLLAFLGDHSARGDEVCFHLREPAHPVGREPISTISPSATGMPSAYYCANRTSRLAAASSPSVIHRPLCIDPVSAINPSLYESARRSICCGKRKSTKTERFARYGGYKDPMRHEFAARGDEHIPWSCAVPAVGTCSKRQ
jgi:hypothetical protein